MTLMMWTDCVTWGMLQYCGVQDVATCPGGGVLGHCDLHSVEVYCVVDCDLPLWLTGCRNIM